MQVSKLYLRRLQQPITVLLTHVHEIADLTGSDMWPISKHVCDDSLKCLLPWVKEARSVARLRSDLQEIFVPIEVPRPNTI